MRKIITLLTLVLLALPALGQGNGRGPRFGFVGNGDAEFALQHAPHNFVSSCEAILPGWSTGELTCNAGLVELGACDAGEEGQTLLAVSTVLCEDRPGQNDPVGRGYCLADHEGIRIPTPARCAKVYGAWALRSLAPTARNGRQIQTQLKRNLVTAEPTVPPGDDLAGEVP